jgi:hypothetical protein
MISGEDVLLSKSSQDVIDAYNKIKTILNDFGSIIYEVKKNSIHCIKNVAFVGLHPKKVMLDINIVLNRSLNGAFNSKTEQVSRNRFHNEIRILNQSQIDSDLIKVLKESYQISK